eukprot:1165928-Pleurochrysis_carterae.AAC.1
MLSRREPGRFPERSRICARTQGSELQAAQLLLTPERSRVCARTQGSELQAAQLLLTKVD